MMSIGDVDSAIVSLRQIVSAEKEYANSHPEIGYTCDLLVVLPELSRSGNTWNGYEFQIACEKRFAGLPNRRYWVTARPLHAGMSAFCVDSSGLIKFDGAGSVKTCMDKGKPYM